MATFSGYFFSLAWIAICILSCKYEHNVKNWNTPFPALGTQSSPRCTDLNQDGVLDIVIGAGMNEYLPTDHGVIALDGKNGSLLWSVPASDQIVGSPTFLDITRDGIQDVIIGGRSHNLLAINGKNGAILWRYEVIRDRGIKSLARFNFFNCQIIPDVNKDGLADILAACGGNSKANPYSMIGRNPGTLMILDSKSGLILAIDTMPDGMENYMSPVISKIHDTYHIIYGTGGETFGGHLYKVQLNDLIHNSLKSSSVLLSNSMQGFIAPPVLADVNKDGIHDVIVSTHDGIVYCLDGITDTIIWKREMNLEANNMLAPGYFNQDTVLDFFGCFAKNRWPHNNGMIEFVLDGKNGSVLFKDSIGSIGFASPISFQADMDASSEVLIHINFGTPNTLSFNMNRSQLIMFDFPGFKKIDIDTLQPFKNISTTPWLGDLDGDSKLEIITCYLMNTFKVDEVGGMYISRKSTKWKSDSLSHRSEYMGNNESAHIYNR